MPGEQRARLHFRLRSDLSVNLCSFPFLRCLSYNCVDGTCRKATDAPNSPKKWVYAIVAILIVLSE